MNVFIEVYTIKHPHVGVGEFCLNLGRHLASRAPELRRLYGIELYFIVPRGQKGVFGNEVHYVSFPFNIKWLSLFYPRSGALLHLTHQYCKYTSFPRISKKLLTIHDINFIYEKHGQKLQKYTTRFEHLLQGCQYANYISHFTKSDVESHFKVHIPTKVIYNGVSKLDKDSQVSTVFMARVPSSPYLFHISSLAPKKNVQLLIDMMQYLPNQHLVIAGNWKSNYGQQMMKGIQEKGLTNITCLNNVSTAEKAWLYQHCKAFLFPSACEGFGLPPIEAMYFGKPVFLSTLTSLPEIGGPQSFYWEQLAPAKMADTLTQKLDQVALHPECHEVIKASAERFDWVKCTDEYINYYLEILQLPRQH